MTKNPLINALTAILYIVAIAIVIFYGTIHVSGPDSVLAPIVGVSLFTLSAAVMGYIFLLPTLALNPRWKKRMQ